MNKKNILLTAFILIFLLSISFVFAQPAGAQRQAGITQQTVTEEVSVDVPLTLLYVLVMILIVCFIVLTILAIITLWKDLRKKKKGKE